MRIAGGAGILIVWFLVAVFPLRIAGLDAGRIHTMWGDWCIRRFGIPRLLAISKHLVRLNGLLLCGLGLGLIVT